MRECGIILNSPGGKPISVASTITRRSGFSLFKSEEKFSGAVPAFIPFQPFLSLIVSAIHGPTLSSPRSSFPTPSKIFFSSGSPLSLD